MYFKFPNILVYVFCSSCKLPEHGDVWPELGVAGAAHRVVQRTEQLGADDPRGGLLDGIPGGGRSGPVPHPRGHPRRQYRAQASAAGERSGGLPWLAAGAGDQIRAGPLPGQDPGGHDCGLRTHGGTPLHRRGGPSRSPGCTVRPAGLHVLPRPAPRLLRRAVHLLRRLHLVLHGRPGRLLPHFRLRAGDPLLLPEEEQAGGGRGLDGAAPRQRGQGGDGPDVRPAQGRPGREQGQLEGPLHSQDFQNTLRSPGAELREPHERAAVAVAVRHGDPGPRLDHDRHGHPHERDLLLGRFPDGPLRPEAAPGLQLGRQRPRHRGPHLLLHLLPELAHVLRADRLLRHLLHRDLPPHHDPPGRAVPDLHPGHSQRHHRAHPVRLQLHLPQDVRPHQQNSRHLCQLHHLYRPLSHRRRRGLLLAGDVQNSHGCRLRTDARCDIVYIVSYNYYL